MKIKNSRVLLILLVAVLLILPAKVMLAADPITIGAPLSTAFVYGIAILL